MAYNAPHVNWKKLEYYEFYRRLQCSIDVESQIYTVHNRGGQQYILNFCGQDLGGPLGGEKGIYLELVNGAAKVKLWTPARRRRATVTTVRKLRDLISTQFIGLRLSPKGRLGGRSVTLAQVGDHLPELELGAAKRAVSEIYERFLKLYRWFDWEVRDKNSLRPTPTAHEAI